jgi:hypothetical protein
VVSGLFPSVKLHVESDALASADAFASITMHIADAYGHAAARRAAS